MWKLRSVFISAPSIVLFTVFIATLSLISSLWDKAGVAQHALARIWARILLRLAFTSSSATGVEKLDPNGTYVLVANHASFLDIPVILSALPMEIRFFAKKGLFSIPFLGWHIRRSGHLEVARGDARASLKSMLEGARLIRERRISVVVFPEGGRSPDGVIRPFIEGAAYIAIKAGVPVVPVGLVNTRGVLPMGTLLLRGGAVEIHVGDPIETSHMTPKDRAELSLLLQEKVCQLAGQVNVEYTNKREPDASHHCS